MDAAEREDIWARRNGPEGIANNDPVVGERWLVETDDHNELDVILMTTFGDDVWLVHDDRMRVFRFTRYRFIERIAVEP